MSKPWTGTLELQYIAQVPNNVHGEQLISQLARAIPDRKWLFRFGRVPLDILTSRSMYERLTASSTNLKTRCKVSVMAQGAAEVTPTYPHEALLPVTNHFYHPVTRSTATRAVASIDAPVQPVRITPLEDQLIEPGLLDAWDFVTRNLFIIKATPLVKSITGLGPGAQALLKKLDDPSIPADQRVDVNKAPRELTVQEWKNVVKAFNDWPFRPENLSIGHMFIEDGRY
ncbi:S-adenosyl-L-methionine-dependent methyltransferase [Coprinellus micaceus]|uniref:rRNA adenine N(6)-methyltransferase n=1 Tax=Coprinellus micaceus TaxID=71717 RepID=A0A4Y7TSX7_COPMI|nr:S-adenosyl-L-methionine-dependent methyltransferase [Coprinellus micaceus]